MVWPAQPRLRAESSAPPSATASVSESPIAPASRSPYPTSYSRRILASKSATAIATATVTAATASVSAPNSAFQQPRQSHLESRWRHSDPRSPSPSIKSSSQSSTIPSTASFPRTASPPNYTHMRSPSPTQEEQEIWSQIHDDYPPSDATIPFSNGSHPAYQSQSYLSPSFSQDDNDDNDNETETENYNDDDSFFIPSAQPRFTNFTPYPPPFTPTAPLSSLPSPPSSTTSRRPSSIVSFTDSQPTLRQGHRNVSPSRSPSRYRNRAQRTMTRQDQEDSDAHILNAVVEGMGRIHVTMDQDAAGRWRIKRRPDSRW